METTFIVVTSIIALAIPYSVPWLCGESKGRIAKLGTLFMLLGVLFGPLPILIWLILRVRSGRKVA